MNERIFSFFKRCIMHRWRKKGGNEQKKIKLIAENRIDKIKIKEKTYFLVLLAPRRFSCGHFDNSTSNAPYVSRTKM